MTLTITPSPAVSEPEAEWETALLKHGYMPDAEDAHAHNPSYWAARAQHSLRAAAEHRDRATTSDQAVRNFVELEMLRVYVREMAADLRLWGAEGAAFLAELQERSPETVFWVRVDGRFLGHCGGRDSAVGDVERMARELRLPEVVLRLEGSRRLWRGVVDGWTVTLGCAKAEQ